MGAHLDLADAWKGGSRPLGGNLLVFLAGLDPNVIRQRFTVPKYVRVWGYERLFNALGLERVHKKGEGGQPRKRERKREVSSTAAGAGVKGAAISSAAGIGLVISEVDGGLGAAAGGAGGGGGGSGGGAGRVRRSGSSGGGGGHVWRQKMYLGKLDFDTLALERAVKLGPGMEGTGKGEGGEGGAWG